MEQTFDPNIDDEFMYSGANKEEKINYLPVAKQPYPLNIRLLPYLPNPKPYFETPSHWLHYGDKSIVVPCNRSNLIGCECPFCKAFFNAKDLYEASAKKDEVAKALMEKYKQNFTYSSLVALTNDPKVYIFNFKTTQYHAVFANPKTHIKGVWFDLKEKENIKPLDYSLGTGWITLNKTGSGTDTKYTAIKTVEEEKQVINGKSVTVTSPIDLMIHAEVLTKVKNGKVPNIPEVYLKRQWTIAEMQAFVDSNGTAFPERIIEIFKKYEKSLPDNPVHAKFERAEFEMPQDEEAPF